MPDARGFETDNLWTLPRDNAETAAAPRGTAFAHDLDAPPPPPPDVVSRVELEQAVARARVDGRRDGEAAAASSVEQAVALALGRIAAELPALTEIVQRTVVTASHDVAALLIAALGRALPGLAADRTEAAVLEVAGLVRPMFSQGEVVARVAPLHADHVARAVASAHLALRVVGDEDVAPGDALLTWDGGSARREIAGIWAEITAALAATGLLEHGAIDR